MRDKLIRAGIKNLKEFGYPGVDAKNILTDYVFRAFFRSMLAETKESAPAAIARVCDELIAEIDAATEPAGYGLPDYDNPS